MNNHNDAGAALNFLRDLIANGGPESKDYAKLSTLSARWNISKFRLNRFAIAFRLFSKVTVVFTDLLTVSREGMQAILK